MFKNVSNNKNITLKMLHGKNKRLRIPYIYFYIVYSESIDKFQSQNVTIPFFM